METFEKIIGFLAFASIGFTVAEVYLTLNKLWKRKHERAVAESISIMGGCVGLIPTVIFSLNYLLQHQWQGVVDGALWIFSTSVQMLIGTGLWVGVQRRQGLWQLVKRSLRVERDEVGDLASRFFRPGAARTILDILGQVTLIDDVLDEREKAFIQTFADAWDIDFSWEEATRAHQAGSKVNFVALQRNVANYLAKSPPPEQVEQLCDVLDKLVRVDENVSEAEELITSELMGMLKGYVRPDGTEAPYRVVIVPQNEVQDEAIHTTLPDLKKSEIAGGFAYAAGPFHSRRYAELLRDEYRELHVFCIVLESAELPT